MRLVVLLVVMSSLLLSGTAHAERGSWYWPDVRASADPSLFMGPGSLELTAVGTWYER